MRVIACHNGKLHTLSESTDEGFGIGAAAGRPAFSSGVPALDALAPGGAFSRGSIHEILCDPAQGQPLFMARLLAQAAATTTDNPPEKLPASSGSPAAGSIVWCDPTREIYPPALAAFGLPLEQLFLLRPKSEKDLVWAVSECLRCKGVSAVIAAPPRLSRIEARRLQLSAERGGGIGLLLRPATARGRPAPAAAIYAAVTRWLVRPAAGEPTAQRWSVQLLHGHGGRLDQPVFLECSRETQSIHSVHPPVPVAHRPAPQKPRVA